MSHFKSNVPVLTMLRQQCKCKRQHHHHHHPTSPIKNGTVKSSSIAMIAALISLKEDQFEESTICTAHCSSSYNEKSSQESFNPSNDLNDSMDHDVDTHDAIITPPEENDDGEKAHKSSDDKSEDKIVSDIPVVITSTSTAPQALGDSDDDDCSNDTVSTLGVESSLNDHPRSIFSNYWDGRSTTQVPSTVRSRSTSFCTSELTKSVPPSSIHSSTDETKSLAAYEAKSAMHYSEKPFQDYDLLNIRPQRNNPLDTSTHDYETALRGYEDGRTILPRAAALNDQQDTDDGTSTDSGTDVQSSKQSSKESLPPPRPDAGPNTPSPGSVARRNIFANTYYNSSCHLPSYRYSNDNILKASSTSALLPTPQRRQRSCLRPLTRSVSAAAGHVCAEGGRVTFDPTVSVLEYDRPHTMQASNGWSKWFV